MQNKNIIAVKNLIRNLDIESLKNPDVVADLIRAFGIVHWGSDVFGEDEMFKNNHESQAGIYQTPTQLSKALVYLSQFEVKSYAEIGIFQGGNFLFVSEYLKRFNPDIHCIGIDPTDYLNPEILGIIHYESWMEVAKATSDDFKDKVFDLVFIDGDHQNGWPERDYDNIGKSAKICMFHDIQELSCPDVMELWNKIKKIKGKVIKEFLEHSAPVQLQGIGIIHDKKGVV